jgi:hypothetical protein
LINASGDSRLYATHHRFCGSTTESVPMRLSQTGIGGGSAAANAAVLQAEAIASSPKKTVLDCWCDIAFFSVFILGLHGCVLVGPSVIPTGTPT